MATKVVSIFFTKNSTIAENFFKTTNSQILFDSKWAKFVNLWFLISGSKIRYMAVGQGKVLVLNTYGVGLESCRTV
jgi:hypothetical protein